VRRLNQSGDITEWFTKNYRALEARNPFNPAVVSVLMVSSFEKSKEVT
jgi:hypothetical protein